MIHIILESQLQLYLLNNSQHLYILCLKNLNFQLFDIQSLFESSIDYNPRRKFDFVLQFIIPKNSIFM